MTGIYFTYMENISNSLSKRLNKGKVNIQQWLHQQFMQRFQENFRKYVGFFNPIVSINQVY